MWGRLKAREINIIAYSEWNAVKWKIFPSICRSALAYAASASVNDTLIGAMSDEEWPVREVAAETIGKIGLNTASQTLIEAMEDEYWQVRVKAARSLGLIKSPTGVSVLATALTHDISNLRKEAAAALGDPDPDLRKNVVWAIDRIKAA